MKRLFLFVLSLLVLSVSYGQKIFELSTVDRGISVINSSKNSFEVVIHLKDLKVDRIKVDGKEFLRITNPLTGKTFGSGEPMLPAITKLIELPADAQPEIVDVSYSTKTIDLHEFFGDIKLVPAQPPQRKDQVKRFVYNADAYSVNKQIRKGDDIVEVKTKGFLRSYRLGELVIRPFDYNPVKNILTVYDDIHIKIKFKRANWAKTQQIKERYSSPVYNFDHFFLNHLTQSKALLQNVPLKLIIIAHEDFKNVPLLNDFIALKEKQGFDVILKFTDEIGSDTTSIRNWLKNYYENNSHPQDFVLFIGDVDKIQSWDQRTRDQHVTDLYYCEYTNDYLPEVFWGRFSVDNVDELNAVLTKTIDYEELNIPDINYLKRALLIAGNDENHEDTWGNGQIYYAEQYYLNPIDGYETHSLYQDPPSGASYSDSIINVINAGVSIANYSAHCSPDGWADPAFSRNDLNGLTNDQKYGIWIGNCCQSNKFDESDAFGEIALYSENKAAVAYIGGSDYTYWDEDYWWAIGYTSSIVAEPSYEESGPGAFDGAFHTMSNELNDVNKWYITSDQLIWAGNLAVESSNSQLKHYYWEIYQVMGDPSLIPYIGIPQNVVINTASPVLIGTSEINLTTNAPYTYITVYQGGSRIGAGITDAMGNVSINTTESISTTTLDVYAYGQNKKFMHTVINAISPNYPIARTDLLDSAVKANSSGVLHFVVANDSTDAEDVIDTVYVLFNSLNTNLIQISTDSIWVGELSPQEIDTLEVDFTSMNATDMTDAYIKAVTYQIVDGDTLPLVKAYRLSIINGVLKIVSMDINDENDNGILDTNETGTIDVKIANIGHDTIFNLTAQVNALNSLISISDNPQTIDTLLPQDTATISYSFTCIFNNPTEDTITVVVSNSQFHESISQHVFFGPPQYLVISDGNTDIDDYPFNNYWKNGKTEILINKNEFSALENITKIGFRLADVTPGGYDFVNFRIGLLKTDLTELSNSTWIDPSSFITVYETESINLGTDTGWIEFPINDWIIDTTKNLLMLIEWGQNANWTSDKYKVFGAATSFNSVLYKNYDNTEDAQPDGVSNLRPAIKLYQTIRDLKVQLLTEGINYNSSGELDFLVQNNIPESMDNVMLIVSSSDSELQITQDTIYSQQNLGVGETDTLHVPYTMGYLPDMSNVILSVKAGYIIGTDTFYLSDIQTVLQVYSPILSFTDLVINDQVDDGYLSPEEQGTVAVSIVNTGHASVNGNLSLSAIPDLITFSDNQQVVLSPNDTSTLTFNFTTDNVDTITEGYIIAALTSDYINITTSEFVLFGPHIDTIVSNGNIEIEDTKCYPFDNYWKNGQTEILILKGEMNGIDSMLVLLGFNVAHVTAGGYDFNNFKIGLYQTDAEQLSSWIDTSNFTTVYYQDVLSLTEEGWLLFPLQSSLLLDSSKNLVVLIAWGPNPSYDPDNVIVYGENTSFTSVLHKNYDYSEPSSSLAKNLRPAIELIGLKHLVTSDSNNTNVVLDISNQRLIYPNPTNNYLYLLVSDVNRIQIINMQGQIVKEEYSIRNNRINVKDLPKGMYIIRITTNNKLFVNKFIKQ